MQSGVRQQGELDTPFRCQFANFLGAIRADEQQLITEFVDLFGDFLQLTQLLRAVRSPTATVENQDRRFGSDGLVQVDGASVAREQRQLGKPTPDQ